MKRFSVLTLMLALTLAPGARAAETATIEQWRQLLDALQAAGCTAVADISVEAKVFEVEDAICDDGKPHDLKLDKSFAVISKKKS